MLSLGIYSKIIRLRLIFVLIFQYSLPLELFFKIRARFRLFIPFSTIFSKL